MKKAAVPGLFLMAAMLMCSGCGAKVDADTDTLFVEGNGKIEELTVETFDKAYYDEEELKEYINSEVEAYKADGGTGSVKMKKYEVKDQTVKLLMEYDGVDSYQSFNDTNLYVGTVLQAQADGYDFDLDFFVPGKADTKKEKVSDTEQGIDGSVQEAVKTSDVLAETDNKVVILQQDTAVQVKGEILYVSGHVEVTGKNTVNVYGEGADSADAEPAYIIYK